MYMFLFVFFCDYQIVFLTTLFYLLASSGNQYKPVELFVSLSPAQRGSDVTFGKAFEDAIGFVFSIYL